ncbi:hypothetical protein D4Z78_06170 [Okeania hirsuta]|nr:hypothetical protein D4Z78_06170 [Okeania hirsuta]
MNVQKNRHHCQSNELRAGDCWIGMTQASSSELILGVGKLQDEICRGNPPMINRGRLQSATPKYKSSHQLPTPDSHRESW